MYRQADATQSDGGDGSSNAASSSLWEDDNSLAAALADYTQGDGALQGVPGLIDVFSCTVTPLRNATPPAPEGWGRTNGTNGTNDPNKISSHQGKMFVLRSPTWMITGQQRVSFCCLGHSLIYTVIQHPIERPTRCLRGSKIRC